MPKITIQKDHCKGCSLCISFCPKGVIQLSQDLNKKGYHFAKYRGDGCMGCSVCAIICPDTCIEVYK